jgi:hypothetical protein
VPQLVGVAAVHVLGDIVLGAGPVEGRGLSPGVSGVRYGGFENGRGGVYVIVLHGDEGDIVWSGCGRVMEARCILGSLVSKGVAMDANVGFNFMDVCLPGAYKDGVGDAFENVFVFMLAVIMWAVEHMGNLADGGLAVGEDV